MGGLQSKVSQKTGPESTKSSRAKAADGLFLHWVIQQDEVQVHPLLAECVGELLNLSKTAFPINKEDNCSPCSQETSPSLVIGPSAPLPASLHRCLLLSSAHLPGLLSSLSQLIAALHHLRGKQPRACLCQS